MHAPTVVFVPVRVHYPHGHCGRVTGGRVVSAADPVLLEVANNPRARRVSVTVRAGRCS